MDLQAIKTEFLVEAEDLLSVVEQHLLAWESGRDAQGIHAMFRAIHTLKGNAQVLGFDALADLTHEFEDALVALRDGHQSISSQGITILLRAVDALRNGSRKSVAGVFHGGEAPLRQALHDLVRRPGGGPEAALAQNDDAAAAVDSSQTATIRVPIEKLDRMVDLIGEVAIGRERIRQMMSEVVGSEALQAVNKDLDHLYGELQELAMRMRMIAVGPVFQQFARVVRDTAAQVGKQARLEISGHDVELDARVIGQLRGGLTHIVRNALVHGIEPPALRTAQGKPGEGKIAMSARHEGGGVVLEVADDGAGFDLERLRARAIELHGPAAENLQAPELIRLATGAGFSTAPAVTELAGRGVGLDVVAKQVEMLHGRLEVESTPGRGARFIMRLPLTLSIIDGFAVRAAGETYIVPMDSVIECLALPEECAGDLVVGHVERHGQAIPFVRLRLVFRLKSERPARESILIVGAGDKKFGIAVDELEGEMQAVIKPLQGLGGVTACTGSAILGNGRVALIVDVGELHAVALSQKH